MHIEFLLEEPSAEAALDILLPNILGDGSTFKLHSFNGKQNLLRKLPERLRGYSRWLPENYRIVVLVDADQQDCTDLKRRLERHAAEAGLRSRSVRTVNGTFQIVNRIAIEELESWYFGDADALIAAYPRLPRNFNSKEKFRDPDGIKGGTWEALEKLLQEYGYQRGGLAKINTARTITSHMNVHKNTSRSFQAFRDVLFEIISS